MERLIRLESNLKSFIITLKHNKKSKYNFYKLTVSQTVSTRDKHCYGSCQSVLLDKESMQKMCDDLKSNKFQKIRKTTKDFCQYDLKDVVTGDEKLTLIYPLEFNCDVIPFFELFISEQKHTDQIELIFAEEKYTFIPQKDVPDPDIYKDKIEDWLDKNKGIWKKIKEVQPNRPIIPYYPPQQPEYPYYPYPPMTPTSPYFDHKFYCTYSGDTQTYFF